MFVSVLSFFSAVPLKAQVSGTITLQNDDRFRGRSVSEGEPVAILALSYDLENGIYVGGSGAVTTNGSGIGILRGSVHIGYATSISRNVAVDGGVVFQAFTDRYSGGEGQNYTEIFAGVSAGNFAVHAFYSPSYLDQNLQTLYVEANAVQQLAEGLRVNARFGVLTRLAGTLTFAGATTRYDTQVGLTKDFEAFSVNVAVGTAGSGRGEYFAGPWQGRDSIIVGISRSF